LVGYAACTAEDVSDESNGTGEAQVTTESSLIGTFRADDAYYGVAVLTLKTDHTFHLEEGMECVHAPCDRTQMNGVYTLRSTTSGSSVLALMPTGHTTDQVEYLQYMVREDGLYVAPLTKGATWQLLRRSGQAWCGVTNDCALQQLPPGPCAGEWYCSSSVCDYTCHSDR